MLSRWAQKSAVMAALSVAATAGVLLTSVVPADAAGRVGSHRVGGTGSSGKGGHYIGGASSGGQASPPGDQTTDYSTPCWVMDTPAVGLADDPNGDAPGLPVCGDGRWYTVLKPLAKKMDSQQGSKSTWTVTWSLQGGDLKNPASLDNVPVTLAYIPAPGRFETSIVGRTTTVGAQHGVVTFSGVPANAVTDYKVYYFGDTANYRSVAPGTVITPTPATTRVITLTAGAGNGANVGGFWRNVPGAPCNVTATVTVGSSAQAGGKYQLYTVNPDGSNGTLIGTQTTRPASNSVIFSGITTTSPLRLRIVHEEEIYAGYILTAASGKIVTVDANNNCRVAS